MVLSLVDGVLRYEPVTGFFHRDEGFVARFLRVHLETGQEVTLSPDHFLVTRRPGEGQARGWSLAAADQLAIGDQLLARGGKDGRLGAARVDRMKEVRSSGVVAPITASGHVVVNGILGSVFSRAFPDLTLATTIARNEDLHGIFFKTAGERIFPRVADGFSGLLHAVF